MNIGLFDVDSHNFPNIALMKLSTYHKKKKDKVELYSPVFHSKYDKVYASKIFTFTKNNYISKTMEKGGTGFSDLSIVLPEEVDNCGLDYTLYPEYKEAYGFLTRGCIRKCPECLVPEKEGKLKAYRNIEDILQGRKTAVIMDNNILASDHGVKQIEKIIELKINVDFNQGLDARLIDNSMAKLLSQVKWLKPLRMACDNINMIEPIRKATELLRWNNCTPSKYFIYVLAKDVESTIERLKFLKGIYLAPFVQPYIDRQGNKCGSQLNDLARWVNHKAIFNSVQWEDYI